MITEIFVRDVIASLQKMKLQGIKPDTILINPMLLICPTLRGNAHQRRKIRRRYERRKRFCLNAGLTIK